MPKNIGRQSGLDGSEAICVARAAREAGMTARESLWDVACRRPIVLAATRVALVVGTILNLINQGELLLDGLPLSWLNLICNYLVPYCVSSYSAARNEMRRNEEETR